MQVMTIMSRPPVVGDYVIKSYQKPESLHNSDIFRVTEVDNLCVKYVLVSEVTPVRGIRKFYKKSSKKYEDSHHDFAKDFTLDVRSVYDAEIALITKNWASIIKDI